MTNKNHAPFAEDDTNLEEERSQRLFAWLTEDEPPQFHDPTVAGKTVPRSRRMHEGSFYVMLQTVKPILQRHWVQTVIQWSPLVLIILTIAIGIALIGWRYL